jgi:hypothetical protein
VEEPDDGQVVTDDRVDGTKKVGIQRRLVEDLAADPVTRRDLPCPEIVGSCVADQEVGIRRAPSLPEMNEPQRQREDDDGRGWPDKRSVSAAWRAGGRRGRFFIARRPGPAEEIAWSRQQSSDRHSWSREESSRT